MSLLRFHFSARRVTLKEPFLVTFLFNAGIDYPDKQSDDDTRANRYDDQQRWRPDEFLIFYKPPRPMAVRPPLALRAESSPSPCRLRIFSYTRLQRPPPGL